MARIVGTEGDDQLGGTAGDDTIILLGGNDTADGGAGNDVIYGGYGNDFLLGGVGDDTLHAERGSDILWGWDGNDYLLGSTDFRTSFVGGNGWDRLYLRAGGGDGSGGEGYDAVDLQYLGAAIITDEGTGRVLVQKGDLVSSFTTVEAVAGSNEDDLFNGRSIIRSFDGRAGNDTINGGLYEDSLYGGQGNDSVRGGLGNDTIDGGGGDDYLNGDDGNDSVYGGDGDDVLSGGVGGVDSLTGAAGSDTLQVWDNFDTLAGGDDVDTATLSAAGEINLAAGYAKLLASIAGAGRCTIYGVENATGSAENDTLIGDARANTLLAGTGDDRLRGGGGGDALYGGRGADKFELRWADVARSGEPATAEIMDFSRSEGDKINLRAIDANAGLAGDQAFKFIGAAAFTAAGQMSVKEVNGDTMVYLNWDAGRTAEAWFTLDGVGHGLKASDFLL